MTHSEYSRLLAADRNRAHQALYDEYINYVYTIVFNRLRSCGTREDMGECVTDIFYEVFAHYDESMAVSEDIRGFIAAVAYRKSATCFRRLCRSSSRSVPLGDELTEMLPSDENISVNAELKEQRRILLELVDSLGEPDSTIIIQKFFYGRSAAEISKLVTLSPMMVRVRSSRALKKLRRLLTDKGITI
ncbi:sigma-70 family RNA polymerase sigma factor [Ruminococcus flavefaciens]|uniref:sigma-70 family RNA polymerase sigma factor n=1 Tax=Ruminococcus flavefaciens TaxID=1265 RepID=UPI00031EF5F8|nr:sigma-70 family RNA polymerase sigma factor [Ruminococcus flavefaciens]